jgi:hypothetical protein
MKKLLIILAMSAATMTAAHAEDMDFTRAVHITAYFSHCAKGEEPTDAQRQIVYSAIQKYGKLRIAEGMIPVVTLAENLGDNEICKQLKEEVK